MNNSTSKNSSFLNLGIKFLFLVLLFFGFPYLVVVFSNKYKNDALGVIEKRNSIIEIESEKKSEIKILTRAEAETLSKIHKFIVGAWVSELNNKYKLVIHDTNKFDEYYDDLKEGFGSWRVVSNAQNTIQLSEQPKFSVATSTEGVMNEDVLDPSQVAPVSQTAYVTNTYYENDSSGDVKYFFQKQQSEEGHRGELYIYQIQQLDTEKFVLVFKNGVGKPLVFVRATTTEDVR